MMLTCSKQLNLKVKDFAAIEDLSEWVLENFPSKQKLKDDPILWDELACYVGEVCREMLDAKWSIE